MSRKKFSEGDVFILPLRSGGYARGVIARPGRKGVLFGYFFGPKLLDKNECTVDDIVGPEGAILVCVFGDHALFKGSWEVIGQVEKWSREEWPLPRFFRYDDDNDKGFLCEYDESLHVISEKKVSVSAPEVEGLPRDTLRGSGVVEILMTRILS